MFETNQTVVIKRTSGKVQENYRIVWGNPLKDENKGEILCNYPKINGISLAVGDHLELSEYERSMKIKENGNIVIENPEN